MWTKILIAFAFCYVFYKICRAIEILLTKLEKSEDNEDTL